MSTDAILLFLAAGPLVLGLIIGVALAVGQRRRRRES